MKQPAKKFFLRISMFFLAIIVVTLVGCRISGDYSNTAEIAGANAPVFSLNGSVLVNPDDLASLRGNRNLSRKSFLAADLSGYVAIEGAEVWIEELPEFPHQITDKDGKYTFTGLPAGIFRVVSAFKKPDNSTVKVRSLPIEISSIDQIATAPAMALAPANKVVSGVLRDDQGEFVPAGTVLILWGEKFVVGQGGEFTSPPLPDDVEMADIIVARANVAVADRPSIPVQFYSPEEPTFVEMQVGNTADSFQPFTAAMNVKINGQPVTVVNVIQNTDIVDLSLNLFGLDRNTAGITYEWDSGRGNFSTFPTITDSAIWIAPGTSGMAVISVKISAPGRGSFKVALPLVVDVPVKAPRFLLTFATNGGSQITAQSIEAEARATEPSPPTRSNFKFAGWYKESALENQWNFSLDKVKAATTIYARWVDEDIATFNLTFATSGGSPVTAQTIETGALANEPAAPLRTGYTFGGWFKETELLNQWNFAIDTINANTELFAKWTAETAPLVRVTFDSQGGSRVTSQIIRSGTTAVEPAAPIRTGYELEGWYKEVALENKWDFTTNVVNTDTVFFAKWVTSTVPSFRVTFDSQGGSYVYPQTVKRESQVIEPALPERTGYTFAGWHKEAALTSLWNFLADKITANTTLFAKWVPETAGEFLVTFNSQSGSPVSAQQIISGSKALEPAAPTLADFTFGGWYKEAELVNSWNFANDKVSSNITLFAKWVSNIPGQFTLTYAAGPNGSITGTSPQTVTAGASGTPILAVPSLGYAFLNWSDGRNDNPRTDINLSANVTATAIFVEMAAKSPGSNKYAYSENAGWINFSTTSGNVFAKLGANGYLSGMAWSENLGWIKFAATTAAPPYANTSATTWGVNMAADGKLSGYAWSESSGWINFSASSATAAINLQTGALSGFAWSENVGWIKFSGSGYGVQFVL